MFLTISDLQFQAKADAIEAGGDGENGNGAADAASGHGIYWLIFFHGTLTRDGSKPLPTMTMVCP